MTVFSVLGLAGAMFLLAATPGPGVFATVSKALTSGFRNAVPVVLGIVAGDLIFLLFAVYGLSLIAETFSALFTLIKYLGGGYLIWSGIKLWRSTPSPAEVRGSIQQSRKYSFLGGLAITLGNPKVILFYLGFLPTFVNINSLSAFDVALIASVVTAVLASVMLFYAFTASRAGLLFNSENALKTMNTTAGTVMIGTGAVLLSKT